MFLAWYEAWTAPWELSLHNFQCRTEHSFLENLKLEGDCRCRVSRIKSYHPLSLKSMLRRWDLYPYCSRWCKRITSGSSCKIWCSASSWNGNASFAPTISAKPVIFPMGKANWLAETWNTASVMKNVCLKYRKQNQLSEETEWTLLNSMINSLDGCFRVILLVCSWFKLKCKKLLVHSCNMTHLTNMRFNTHVKYSPENCLCEIEGSICVCTSEVFGASKEATQLILRFEKPHFSWNLVKNI